LPCLFLYGVRVSARWEWEAAEEDRGRTRSGTAVGLRHRLRGRWGLRAAEAGERVQVAATISVLQDLVEQVGGDRVEAFSIVPVGGSPET
jgi:hypothetical protein